MTGNVEVTSKSDICTIMIGATLVLSALTFVPSFPLFRTSFPFAF